MPVYNTITPTEMHAALLADRSYNGYNGNVYQIPHFSVGAWAADNSVTLADCTNPLLQNIVGVTNAAIPAHSRGLFVQSGVVPGAIAHMGARAGDPIYLGITAGTLTNIFPSGPGVTPIQIGTAETSETSSAVTDLRLSVAVSSSGGGGGGGVSPADLQGAISASQSNIYTSGELTDTISQFSAVYWTASEDIMAGDATNPDKIDIAGVTTGDVVPGGNGIVQYIGTVQNACASLGANAGQAIYLAAGPGGVLTKTPPAPIHYTVIIGYAVPRSGTSGPATDLLLDIQRALIL